MRSKHAIRYRLLKQLVVSGSVFLRSQEPPRTFQRSVSPPHHQKCLRRVKRSEEHGRSPRQNQYAQHRHQRRCHAHRPHFRREIRGLRLQPQEESNQWVPLTSHSLPWSRHRHERRSPEVRPLFCWSHRLATVEPWDWHQKYLQETKSGLWEHEDRLLTHKQQDK